MCIHISLADNLPEIATWDPDEVVIRVASLLRCFCGMRVELPRELVTAEVC
ncbi:hypothetical protein AB0I51_09950 [Streptomyces sp. NPDC050549]|uniref:hypothetical protein n=1 Tax=Streptomyces sp. NPDC050549 TaxID=3155406 RepID=UPI003434A2A7